MLDATQYIQQQIYNVLGSDDSRRQEAIAEAVANLRAFACANEQLKAALLTHADKKPVE
jgi:hypothetical protein